MSNNKIIIALILLLVIVGGYFLLQGQLQPKVGQEQQQQEGQTQEPSSFVPAPESENVPEMIVEERTVVTYTDSGFSPLTTTIKVGGEVLFINKSSNDFWPASDVHPTHQVYPNSDIQKCFTGQTQGIFDACRPLSPGTSWSFVFEHPGTWRYHDHLNPGFTGTIIVQ